MLEYPYRNYLNKHGGLGDRGLSFRKNYELQREVPREFMENSEFDDFLTDAIEWKGINEDVDDLKDPESLEGYITRLIGSIKEVKGHQEDIAEAVFNVRDSYFRLKQGFDKYKEGLVQEEDELKYGLLELENLLVNAGLLDPREIYTEEAQDMRIKRAMNLFDDICIIFQPELFSPKHTKYIETVEKQEGPKQRWTSEERSNEMGVSGIGHCLNSLVDMAYSQYRDLKGKDYEDEVFRKAIQGEVTNKTLLDPTYTKIWKDTYNRMEDILKKYIEPNISQCFAIENLFLFAAYNRMGFSLKSIFPQMMHTLTKDYKWIRKASLEDLYTGLYRFGMCCYAPPEAKAVAREMATEIYKRCQEAELHYTKHFCFQTLWGLCNFELYDHPLTTHLVNEVNKMPVDRSNDDLFPYELSLLKDIGLAIKVEGNGKCPELAPHMDVSNWYKGENKPVDPCKSILVKGITDAISEDQTMFNLIPGKIEYERRSPLNKYIDLPDLVLGCRGKKVAVYVVNESGCTNDTKEPNGILRFRFRISESADPYLKCEVFPIQEIIEFDTASLTVKIKDNCRSVLDILNGFAGSSDFGLGKITNVVNNYLNSFTDAMDRDPSLGFMLLRMIRMDRTLQSTYHDTELAIAIANLKVELARIAMNLNKMPKKEVEELEHYAKKEGKSFIQLLKDEKDLLSKQESKLKKDTEGYEKLSRGWFGQRLTINIPSITSENCKDRKNIGPEIIDINFMLLNDYAHYKDWKATLKKYYDGLNLLTIEPKHNYLFSEPRIDCGIFPDMKEYRKIDMLHIPIDTRIKPMEKEKSPMLYLAKKEMQKEMWNKQIPVEVKMMANLLNIKHGLKVNYPYSEIMSMILSFDFIQALIKEHLGEETIIDKDAIFIPRDPGKFNKQLIESYKNFLKKQNDWKNFGDLFTNFYLQECHKREQANTDVLPEDKDQFNIGTYMRNSLLH